MATTLDALTRRIRACRLCIENPDDAVLPHEPNPVFQVSRSARLAIFSQAPGMRAHLSGKPFSDPSGVRLRQWMGVSEDEFYDPAQVAIVPMGFCFPGYDKSGGDLPPRRECAPTWRAELLGHVPKLEVVLLVGSYSQRWHLGDQAGATLTATVADWRAIIAASKRPLYIPLPHPSWRNNGWMKRNPWFEAELLPELKAQVDRVLRR